MNRAELQRLAEARIDEAGVLLKAKKYSGAYYLAGYAIEFGFKACIAKKSRRYAYPDKDFAQKCYTHNLRSLLELAGLPALSGIPQLQASWAVVKDWNEQSRFEKKTRVEAESIYEGYHRSCIWGIDMDSVALVDRRIEDGHRLLVQLLQDGFDVVVAFWLKSPDDAWPHLFISTRLVDQMGPLDAYRALQTSMVQLPGISISLEDVKLIGVGNHIASAARNVLKKARREGPVEIREGQISNVAVEYAYLYRPPASRMPRASQPGH